MSNGCCLFRLKASGAVLVAKLVPGSLGYDDIWFGGQTKNPWNIKELSTGASAGLLLPHVLVSNFVVENV